MLVERGVILGKEEFQGSKYGSIALMEIEESGLAPGFLTPLNKPRAL